MADKPLPSTRLPDAARAWPSDTFKPALKHAIEGLGPRALPLDQAVGQSCYLGEDPVTASVFQTGEDDGIIEARVGVFFTEILASCGCGGEPMEQNAYCELRVRIDKVTAATEFTLITD